MATIGIVTDSSCDLSVAALLRQGIAVAAHRLHVGNEIHRDWREVPPEKLYSWMLDQNLLPELEAPQPEDFVDVYRKFLDTHDELISVHLSAKLSPTLEHARMAARSLQVEDRITFVDSGTVSVGLGEVVTSAATLANSGASKQHILWEIDRVSRDITLFCTPESLEWLIKYKQTARPASVISTMTRQRPLYVLEQGDFKKHGNLTYTRVTDNLISLLKETFGNTPIRLSMGTAGTNRADIEGLKLSFGLSDLEVMRGRVQTLGGFLGCRYGPGTVVVCAHPAVSAALAV